MTSNHTQCIRKVKYKVNSRSDGYWYYVFTELTDEIKNRLDIRYIMSYDNWFIVNQDGNVSYCWEPWARRVKKEDIERWLEE